MSEQILEFQQQQQEIQHLYQSLEQLAQQRSQVAEAIDAIEQIQKVENVEILTPLVNGIFFNANLSKVTEFSINVGNGVVVKKSPKETKELMKSQLEEMDKMSQELTIDLGKKLEKIQKTEESLKDV